MPNYSHGNKLTVAAVDEPPYLTVGTDVSAKYKGAFCEAKIIDVNKHVKLKVLFDGHPGIYMIDDTELKQGTVLELGSKIEARHPEKKQQVYTHATITKILDQSRYTVVFDDGDQCILRRNSICLKSGKHFAESETLDQLPLTNPEHFGNPVKVGQASLEQNNHNNSTNNQQQVANQSTNRLNNNINNNNSNSSSTSGGSSKNGFVDFNNQASSTTSNNGKAQNNVKLETDRPNKGKSISSASSSSNANNTSSTATLSSGASGRRGSAKGRKRSESTTINSKQTSELEDELGDDSQDSADVDPGESDVNFELIEIGVKLMVQYGKGKVQNVYEAKVNKMETNSSGRTRYFVHYTGWNNRYDEWITKSRILNIVSDKEGSSKDGRSKQPEPNSTSAATNASPTTSSDSNTNRDSMVNKEKEKEKDVKVAAKTPRRSRQVDPASSATAVTVPNSTTASSVPSATAASTTTVAKPTLASTSSQDKEKERVKEKEKDVNPIARTPRRSRQVDAALAPVPALSTSNAASTPTVPVVAPASSVAVSKPTVSSAPSHDKDKDKERVKEKDANLMVRTPRRSRQVDAASIAPAVATSNSTSATSVPAPTPTATATDIKPNATSAPSQDKDTERVKEREKEKVREKDREKIREKEREKVREREREREKAREKEKERAKEKEKEREKLKEKERERAREKEKEKTEEKDLDRQEDKCPAVAPSLKSGRPRLSDALSSSPCADKTPIPPTDDKEREPPTSPSKDTNATITTNDATTTTIITTTTSAASSTSSIASSSSSPSYSLASTNPALSVLATLSEKEIEKFIIDEPDCDKRISILQDKIMSIRQTYKTLKAELADLDRRRKRPRLERGYVSELTKVMFT